MFLPSAILLMGLWQLNSAKHLHQCNWRKNRTSVLKATFSMFRYSVFVFLTEMSLICRTVQAWWMRHYRYAMCYPSFYLGLPHEYWKKGFLKMWLNQMMVKDSVHSEPCHCLTERGVGEAMPSVTRRIATFPTSQTAYNVTVSHYASHDRELPISWAPVFFLFCIFF